MRRTGRPARSSHGAYRIVITAILLVAALAVTPISIVRATTFTVAVNDTLDEIHNPGCATTGTGTCSLRDAILYANSKTGADRTSIALPAATFTLTIPGQNEDGGLTGDLDITGNVSIVGAGPAATIVQASATGYQTGIDRVFHFFSANSSMSQLTIRYGGNVSTGGGIEICNGTLTLTHDTVEDNSANEGGGIDACGLTTLVVSDSTFSGNVARFGGGISSQGSLAITDTRFVNNSADDGGAIECDASSSPDDIGTATITGTTVTGNSGTSFAGGIDNRCNATIQTSTIAQNTAPNFAGIANVGGYYPDQPNKTGILHISNSTIAGNTATGQGGGVTNNDGLIDVTNSTLAGNTASLGGNIMSYCNLSPCGVTIRNSIVASGSCSGPVSSQGHNIDSGTTCPFNQSADLVNTDPSLAPLGDYGGLTQTRALQSGSPAIDHGGTSVNGCPSIDQRGVPRPQGQACDIGAYEYQPPPPSPLPTTRPGPVQGTPSSPLPGGRSLAKSLLILVPGIMGPSERSCENADDRAKIQTFPDILNLVDPDPNRMTVYAFRYGLGTSCPLNNQPRPRWYSPDDNHQHLDTSASQLNDQINDQIATFGVPSEIDILTHSQGGVVALLWAYTYQKDITSKYGINTKIITLDSPVLGCLSLACEVYQGTVFNAQSVKDMNDCSVTVREAAVLGYVQSPACGNQQFTSVAGVTVYAVANHRDGVVPFDDAYPGTFPPTTIPNEKEITDCSQPSHPWIQDYYELCHGSVLVLADSVTWVAEAILGHPLTLPPAPTPRLVPTPPQSVSLSSSTSANSSSTPTTNRSSATPVPLPQSRP